MIHIESVMNACKDSLSGQMHEQGVITIILLNRGIKLNLRDRARQVFDVIESIFGVKACSLVILDQELSETLGCAEEEVHPFLLVESMENDVHDDVLAFDPAKKVLWLSHLSRLHDLKCYLLYILIIASLFIGLRRHRGSDSCKSEYSNYLSVPILDNPLPPRSS
jgi:hypothetical protein